MSNITKLTPTNYLMWSRQVHALLDGYDLAGYIDGSITAPSETINTAGTATTNTAYKFWKRQDKLIYSAILAPSQSPFNPSSPDRTRQQKSGTRSSQPMLHQAGAISSK